MNRSRIPGRSLLAASVATVALGLATVARAQNLPVASVDVYGTRTVDPADVVAAASVPVGVPLAESTAAIESRLRALPGVKAAKASLIGMQDSMVLFLGVLEEGGELPAYREAPTGDVRLPSEVVQAYDRAMAQLVPAIRSGQGGEDTSEGHSLSGYEPMREQQLLYLEYAEDYFLELVDVLRESRHDKERAVAATVLAYVSDKAEAIPELEFAASDPSSLVRNNAVRALAILGGFAADNPELELVVDPQPFVQLVRSLTWTDRNKGAAALAALSRARDPELFRVLRQQCLEDLAEMARWHSVGHAMFSLEVLGRMAGLEDTELEERRQRVFQDREERVAWVAELTAAIESQAP